VSARRPEQLVREARRARLDGDERTARRAAAEAWLRCQPRVRLVIARKAGQPLADEIESDVMERFARWLFTTDDDAESLIALLVTMARRAIADAYRRRPPEDFIDYEPGRDDDDLARVLERAEATDLLAALPEREREVLEAIYLRDEPRDAVAARLGVTPNNLYQIHFRAIRRLRAAHEESG
jgi:RNA polymerase sigma factor (sigma-70 family)